MRAAVVLNVLALLLLCVPPGPVSVGFAWLQGVALVVFGLGPWAFLAARFLVRPDPDYYAERDGTTIDDWILRGGRKEHRARTQDRYTSSEDPLGDVPPD